jgi:hypothetical protein
MDKQLASLDIGEPDRHRSLLLLVHCITSGKSAGANASAAIGAVRLVPQHQLRGSLIPQHHRF